MNYQSNAFFLNVGGGGGRYYFKKLKEGDVLILDYCEGVQILLFHFFGKKFFGK